MERDPAGIFIPEEVLNEIIKGSQEVILALVAEAVQENAQEKFGAGTARVLATFPGYVLIATDRAEFFRVKYNLVKESVNLQSVEQIKLPVITQENVVGYVKQQARRVVDDLFRGGSAEDLCSRLHDLSETVIESERKFTPGGLEEAIRSRVATESDWWAGLSQNEDVLRSAVESMESSGIVPKFRAIIDGTIEEDELDKYRELVRESLCGLAKYASELGAAVPDLTNAVLKTEFVSDESEGATREFRKFVELYHEDVSGLASELWDAVDMFDENCLVCSAEIHDQVAAILSRYESGNAFIRQFADRFDFVDTEDDSQVDGE